jgi:hypothetical protein
MSEFSDPQVGWNESLEQVMDVMREFLKGMSKPAAVMKLKEVLSTQTGTERGQQMTCLMLSVAILRLCENEAGRSQGPDSFPA